MDVKTRKVYAFLRFRYVEKKLSWYRVTESFVIQGIPRKLYPENILSANGSKNTGYAH